MTIEDFLSRVNDKTPPAPDKRLRKLESELGTSLPDDYRRFLIASNGGYVGGALWFLGPTPDGQIGDAGVHHIYGLGDVAHRSVAGQFEASRDKELRIPAELVPIMDDPFGNWICIGFAGPFRGRIYFWDHEAYAISLLAESFTGFVAGLQPTPQS